nr:uncharacterized protein LOC108008835 [Drosophila suzukii]
MFKSSNKQVTSKFQSVGMQRIVPGKSSNIGYSKKHTSSVALISDDKSKNVAKTSSASGNLSANKVSEKTPENSSSKQKCHSQQSIKIAVVKPKTVGKNVQNPNSKTMASLTSRPPSSRSTGSTVSSRTQQFNIPLRTSNGVTSRIYRPFKHGVFDYHLSPLEKTVFAQSIVYPMKSVPAVELQLLRNGQRSTYLERRYERSPDDKYNYPEATSWRYGWFHRESDPFQKRIPRRD